MRKIKLTNAFKRDQKRVDKSNIRSIVKQRFIYALKALANDEVLDYSYHDHALIVNWAGYRECHLAFDLVLIYRLEGNDLLVLEKIGSHSEVLGL